MTRRGRDPRWRRSAVVVALVVGMAPMTTGCASTPAPTEPPSRDVAGPTSLANTTEPAPMAPAEQEELMAQSVPITITVGDTVLDAQLWDIPTAADLVDRLPLTLRFTDFGAVEKTARLEGPLTMDGVPSGADPEPYDIGYYQPNQVLVLYYRDVGYWPGIVRLGTITDPAGVVSSQQQPFVAEIHPA